LERLGFTFIMSDTKHDDPRLARISSSIRAIPDFPKKGIMFRDVTTLLLDHQAFKDSIDIFVERYQGRKIDVVAGEVACEVDQSLFTDSFGQQFFCRLSPVSCKFPVYTSISCTENVPIGGLLQIQLKVTFNNDLQCFDIQGLKLEDSYLGHQSHWPLVPSLCLFASPTNCQVQ
jgi:hypothetical protein